MADENTDQNNDQTTNDNQTSQSELSPEAIQKLVEAQVAENLKPIKEKLDKAYSARDEALKKLAEIEQKEREAELKRLEEEGKHKEAYEMRYAEQQAKLEALEKKNVELTRDMEVRNILSTYQFRNEKAVDMAYQDIIAQLVRNEHGLWVHKSGGPIRDFVKSYSEDENNAFLFKPKVSTGGGSTTTATSGPSSETTSTSMFSRSQEENIRLAREGKLRR